MHAASSATTLVLAAGVTQTATIPGISAAGADPDAMGWTPSADAEVLTAGEAVRAPEVPRSPTGCPTPAVVTRAVRELLEFDVMVIDAGLSEPTAADTMDVGAVPGGDVRNAVPVPDARSIFDRAREIGADATADHLLLAETIPGGTTTGMGVLSALGERTAVSSSLPDNPLECKRAVVEVGLAASDVEPGDLASQPREALRRMGDPVLAALAGVVTEVPPDVDVTLAGGTQLACVGALARHAGVDRPLALATTQYVAEDDSADVRGLADDLALDIEVTDPGFDEGGHPALVRFAAGEAKEGVGMGGVLALAADRGEPAEAIRERTITVYDRCVAEAP